MTYAMSHLDASGVVSATLVLDALKWNGGDRIDVSIERSVAVIRRTARGGHIVPMKRKIAIPAAVRRACGIRAGEVVLLAAAPLHQVLLIHPESVLNMMMTLYHAASERHDEPA